MMIDLGEHYAKYYSSFLKSTLWGTLPLSILSSTPQLITGFYDEGINIYSSFISFLLYFLIFELVLAFSILTYTISIKENGIYGYNFSMKKAVRWDEMHSVEKIRYLGIPYVLIQSSEKEKLLYIPLNWLSNEDMFRKKIVESAGKNHPLSKLYTDI